VEVKFFYNPKKDKAQVKEIESIENHKDMFEMIDIKKKPNKAKEWVINSTPAFYFMDGDRTKYSIQGSFLSKKEMKSIIKEFE
jgi:hypothetical protein